MLVNNAGYGPEGPVEEVPIDEVRRQFETNVFGLARLSQLVLPGMRRQGWGKIVNVSSMGGRLTLPGGGFYHATKYAVEAISDALRFEVQGFGVDVVVIEPGPIKTEFGDTAIDAVDGLGVRSRRTPPSTPSSRSASAKPTRARWAKLAADAGRRRQGDRDGDHRRPPAHALSGHVRRALPDGRPPLAPRPCLRRDAARRSSRRARPERQPSRSSARNAAP